MTLLHFPYLLVSVQLNYTYKIEQKGVSAKANPLNTNDLGGFYRQELCRLFGEWGGVIGELRPMCLGISIAHIEHN